MILRPEGGGEWHIRLLDNPFVEEWLQHLERCIELDPNPQLYNKDVLEKDPFIPTKHEVIERLNSALEELNRDFNFNCPLKAHKDMDRDTTNALHRAFTTAFLTKNRWQMDGEPQFEVPPEKIDRFSFLTEEINFAVHDFENFLYPNDRSEQMSRFAPRHVYNLLLLEFNNKDHTNQTRNDMFRMIKEEHYKYFSTEHNVFIKIDILGKDHLQAFLDKDDPRSWDVTHNVIYTGGIEIDPYKGRTFFKKSSIFKEWLSSYDLEPSESICGYMPIGDIEKRDRWVSLRESTKIEIVESKEDFKEIKYFYFPELIEHLEVHPYLDLKVEFDHEACFKEAEALLDEYVVHRGQEFSEDEARWMSLPLRAYKGRKENTLFHTEYTDSDDPYYALTEVAVECPETLKFIENLTNIDSCKRIRFMLLEPGAKIKVHRDSPDGSPCLSLNIALNMPQGCEFVIGTDKDGSHNRYTEKIPMTAGSVMLINVGNYHYVENNSEQNRIHMIIDGPTYIDRQRLIQLAEEQNQFPSPKARVQRLINKVATSGRSWEQIENYKTEWYRHSMDRDILAEIFQIVITVPEVELNGDELEKSLNNFSYASLFPLHHKTVKESQLDQFLKDIPESDDRFVLIVGAGSFFFEVYHFCYEVLRTIAQMESQDVGLCGHIMNRGGEKLPFLHEQFAILDIRKYRQWSRPSFGLPEKFYDFEMTGFEVSPENVHDDYTPLWLKPTCDKSIKSGRASLATEVIHRSLESGRDVINLDGDLRKTKDFSYPRDINGPNFKRVIEHCEKKWKSETEVIYFFNNEDMRLPQLEGFEPNTFATVCAGFKGATALYQYFQDRAPVKSFIVDYSQKALDFFKEAYQKTSRVELKEHFLAWGVESSSFDYHLNRVINESFDSSEEAFWTSMGHLAQSRFLNLDLMTSFEEFTKGISPGDRLLFWTSNPWNTSSVYFRYSREEVERLYQDFARSLAKALDADCYQHTYHQELIFKRNDEILGFATDGCRAGLIRDFEDFQRLK